MRRHAATPSVSDGLWVGSALMAEDALAKIAKADQMIYDLCQGKKRWTMSVPAQPDSDPDLVIHDALAVARLAINTLVREGCARSAGTSINEQLRDAIADLRAHAQMAAIATNPEVISAQLSMLELSEAKIQELFARSATEFRTAVSKSEYKRVTAQGGKIRPPKPRECAVACPQNQVCDHCQWTPDATTDRRVTKP